MKKIFGIILVAFMPLVAMAETYPALWKKVTEAQAKDLPKTQMEWLDKIIAKAQAGADYGQLLKAQLFRAAAQTQIAPDSAVAEIARVERMVAGVKNPVMQAVYATVLGKLYEQRFDKDDSRTRSKQWFDVAMQQPGLLAQHKCAEYEPAVVEGADSKVFGDDLLHVVGMEAKAYAALRDYYESKGNRPAACLCACLYMRQGQTVDNHEVRRSKYLQALDSLISVYGDLREAGELAVDRYQFMEEATDVNTEDKVNYINYALSRWGEWPRMNILRNAMGNLRQPTFNISVGDYVMLPQTDRLLRINSIRNIGTLTVNVYRTDVAGDCTLDPNEEDGWAELQKHIVAEPVQTLVRRYVGQPAWKENSDSITVKALPVGVYVVEATTDNSKVQPQRTLLCVSNLFVMSQALPDRQIRFAVVNATTGDAVPDARLRLTTGARYDNEKEQTVTLVTDKNGEAYYKYDKRAPGKVYAYTDTDKALNETAVYANYRYWKNERVSKAVRLFADRSVYRPGQQVHVAAMAYEKDDAALTTKPQTGHALKLTLYDANGRQLATKEVTTDSYGTASADFTLPQTGLTGYYSVTTGEGGIVKFRVEEYKRPTFEVTFEPYKGSYQPGDTVKVRAWAKSYSGVPVQGAKVSYEVNRRPALWWSWRTDHSAKQLVADSTVTAADGAFTLKLPMVYPETADLDHAAFFNIVANAKVTDGAGETHEAQTSLMLSNRSALLTVDLPEQSLRDSLKVFTVKRTNFAGEPLDGTASYRFDGRTWKTAAVNRPVALSEKMSSGKHELEVICGQDTVKKTVVVFSYSDKKPVVPTHDWFHVSHQQFPNDGSAVYLQVGTSDKDAHVYYSVFTADRMVASGVGRLDEEVVTRKLHYKEEYGGGITIALAWVKDGKMYRHQVSVTRPVPDTQLRLSWKTFRDKLTPGQKEQWTLHVETPQGKPAAAQLLATMYDKSLDALASHRWDFDIRYTTSVPMASWNGGNRLAVGLYGFESCHPLTANGLDFSHFDSGMFRFANPYTFRYGAPMMLMARENRALATADAAANTLDYVPAKSMEATRTASVEDAKMKMRIAGLGSNGGASDGDGQSAEVAQVRENRNETAFFYPALTTDGNGNVNISFTLPESVTTWKFMALAHDAAFDYGWVTAEATASKTVMIQPNMPRFIRQGDRTAVVCRIANTSGRDVKGKARLQFVNPEDNKVVEELSVPFEAAAGQNTTAEFMVDGSRLADLADGATLFIVRALAEGKDFSDGEQQYLPLLPDREYVTTTLPFTQTGAGVKTIDISALFPSHDRLNKLTVEYTNNPAWLMIQALPAVASPADHNAVSLAAAIYSNTIAHRLLASDPSIGQTVKLWQMEQGSATTLTSSLQKNGELKSMLLSETPWVADADRETEQKQRLADYLDESAVNYRLDTFFDKLSGLQNPDGSFSWWPGMSGNKYMTMEVAGILARLKAQTGALENANLLTAAFVYLDRRIAEEVVDLKKEAAKKTPRVSCPSEFACDYLYASALTQRKRTDDMSFLLNLLAKQNAGLTIYGKARSAVVLAQYGYEARAKEYLQSLNEYAVYTEEMGRYYDTHRALYSWKDYRIPTQVAAIEAVKRLTPQDTKTVEEMQRWLLQEKRTQAWDTPVNTVDAVYAFLADEKGQADMHKLSAVQADTLKVDGKRLDLPKATLGLGYVKTVVDGQSPLVFTVGKTSGGTSWGALYAQYWQKASDVEAMSSGLSVRREVFLDGKRVDGKAAQLKVGDKVTVRITVVADRDYDFVQVQDKRAACLEPVSQQSGYRWGCYCAPKDNVTNYYFDLMAKGEHVVETDYYVDRQGEYASGICTVQCAYSPEFAGREGAKHFTIIR